jgi:RimJ/RimL family protein N-acetyltransferase
MIPTMPNAESKPRENEFGQPIGFPLSSWKAPEPPSRAVMYGNLCRLEAFDCDEHSAALFETDSLDKTGVSWTYLSYGPFPTLVSYQNWLHENVRGDDPLFFAIVDNALNKPVGLASYLRIAPSQGSIEVGHIHYSPRLQKTPAATEAMYLMMKRAFELGYRRYEWKCDSLNAGSRKAAQRLGFSYEGIFRQANVYKGRNRDTAWYAIIDSEWPALRAAFGKWLDPANFDAAGKQRIRLSDLTAPILKARG